MTGPAPAPAGLPWGAARSVAVAVARRPELWSAALGAVLRLAAPGWWRRRPYLPLPDGKLWAFRMVTAYGQPDAVPEPGDVVSYLTWCRTTRTARVPRGTQPAGGPR